MRRVAQHDVRQVRDDGRDGCDAAASGDVELRRLGALGAVRAGACNVLLRVVVDRAHERCPSALQSAIHSQHAPGYLAPLYDVVSRTFHLHAQFSLTSLRVAHTITSTRSPFRSQ